MVWIVDKKIFYHCFETEQGRVKVPIRATFECEVQDSVLVQNSMSIQTLYNREALHKYCPTLNLTVLEDAMEKSVARGIAEYLREYGVKNPEDFSGKLK